MHIGLIAVSGVRIYNERLVRLGVTLPGFVERAETIASMPSLGLLTLAATVPDRHQLTYLEQESFDEAALAETCFDVVAISSFTAKAHVMYQIADFYRARGTRVVLGGLHVTLLPEEAAQHADAIVVGEGERLFPRVLEDIERNELDPVYRNGSFSDVELGQTPAPRYDLLDAERYNRVPVQTTRGCPLACEFCAASRIFGGYKRKPISCVIRDIRAAKRCFSHPFFELADDNTFVHKPWSRSLVRAIGEERIQWFTETDVAVAEDPALLDALAASGCRQLLIGFESPRGASLAGIDRANWKLRHRDRYMAAIDAIQSRGISVNGCFILGLDQDTPDVFEEVEEFVRGSGLTEVQVTVLTPFPGTALYDRLKAEGRLLRDRYWDRCTLFDVNYRPRRMSVEELEQGLEYLMGALYSPAETRRRKGLFLSNLRAHRRAARLPKTRAA